MNTKFCFLLILSFVIKINAQLEFEDHQIFQDTNLNYANGPIAVFSADLDNDGDLDIISASIHNNKIAWNENLDGKGIFGDLQVISNSVIRASHVQAADIDSDGDLDVIATSENYNNIVWFENTDGEGAFSSGIIISSNNGRGKKTYSSDIDNDGDLDLFVVLESAYTGIIGWLENIDGKGEFGDLQIIVDDVGNHNVFPSDFDNDGAIDIIATYSNELHWYRNDGQGNFIDKQKIHSYNGDYYRSIYSSDLDSDGDLDILFALGGQLAWSENIDGIGTFSSKKDIKDNFQSYDSVYATDLDNDGDIDVIVASRGENKITWFENSNGQGDFAIEHVLSENVNSPTMIRSDDINGDGNYDVLSTSYYSDAIVWYSNTGNNGIFSSLPQSITANINSVNAIQLADINNDTNLDIVFSGSSTIGGKIGWYPNIDNNTNFDIQHPIDVVSPESTISIDLDSDNDNDLIYKRNGTGSSIGLFWKENLDGKGTFSKEKRIYDSYVNRIIIEDIDKDNDLDIIIQATYELSKILWLENEDGKGGFGDEKILYDFNDNREILAIESGDLNKDGYIDLIYSVDSYNSAGFDSIYWLPNNNGVFDRKEYLTKNKNHITQFKIIDIDNDGDFDIANSFSVNNSGSSGGVQWHENNQMEFGTTHLVQDGPSQNLSFDDLDLDGNIDIITNNSSDIVWYKNLGQGLFGPSEEISNGLFYLYNHVFTGDIDNDGDIDILFADIKNIIWSENLIIDNSLSSNDILFENNNNEVYPNPVRENLFFNSKISFQKVKVFDIMGKLVLQEQNQNEIDFSYLKRGVYFVQVYSNSSLISAYKVIKE